MSGANQQDALYGGNVCLSKAALNLSNVTTGAINIANNVTYAVDGVMNTISNNWSQLFSSGHTTLAAGCECHFAVWVNAAGTVSTTQGKIVDTASLSSSGGTKVVPMPEVVSAAALIGLIKVKTAGAATFVPGTTNLNATNVTATYQDTMRMASTPALS